ncbi:MAG: hypothetical protein ACC707_15390 [Thiohalomonadales bacterium]
MATKPTFTDEELTVLKDPYTSNWLRKQIQTLHGEEPKASARDAEVLAHLQAARCLRDGIARRSQ